MADFEFVAVNSRANPISIISNPVNAFIIIKKLTRDLDQILSLINTHPAFNGMCIIFPLYQFVLAKLNAYFVFQKLSKKS
jgi:hypothetical protein